MLLHYLLFPVVLSPREKLQPLSTRDPKKRRRVLGTNTHTHTYILSHTSVMRVFLHVRDKVIAVECGDGSQPVRWLGSVGVARYDEHFGKFLGAAKGLQKEGGVICEPTERIRDVLEHEQHCFVLLSDFHLDS